jgi:hypothetical protein
VRLRPREAFGAVPPVELDVPLPPGQESGEAQGCFRLQIPDL